MTMQDFQMQSKPLSYCRCCGNPHNTHVFRAQLLGRNVSYYDCNICGYVQTETPAWLDEAYSSPINTSDTGVMSRNLSNISLVLATLSLMGCRKSKVVDYAGGHGFLVRLLRDIGLDALWADPYSQNLVARGFEYNGTGLISLVTAFEAYEHFVNPTFEMFNLLKIAPNILLTTTLISDPPPKVTDWWYYGLEHGQHIGFYRVKTLQYLASKYNLNLLTDGRSRHFFSEKKYSYLSWRFLLKIAAIPKLLSFGLHSKIQDDHLQCSS